MHRLTLVAMAGMLALGTFAGGCTCTVQDPCPVVGQTIPTGAPVHRILPGEPTIIQPGVQAGYGITANTGGSYRLVWTGDAATSGTFRRFHGSVWTAGFISNIVDGCNFGDCPLESNDSVAGPIDLSNADRIDFDADTANGIDGFDFVVDQEPVFFDLRIDNGCYPELVFFPATDNGGAISSVADMPFSLTSN